MCDNSLQVHEKYDVDSELDVLNVNFEGKMIEYTITSLDEDDPMAEENDDFIEIEVHLE